MLYIFLKSDLDNELMLTPESEALRVVIADNPDIFGAPNSDYELYFQGDVSARNKIEELNVKDFPALVFINENTDEEIKRWEGKIPNIKIVLAWAKTNTTRPYKRNL